MVGWLVVFIAYRTLLVWFSLVLLHINPWNTKSSLFILIKYIRFVNTFCWSHFQTNHIPFFFNAVTWFCNNNNLTSGICLHTVKWLQVLLFNSNYSIEHSSFIWTQLNDSKYFYASQRIQLEIIHLFTNSSISNDSFSLNVKQPYLTHR